MPMNTKIKICGLKTVEDIKMINKYPVDYIGLVFAESKRRVSREVAKEMIQVLDKNIQAVGVFVNTPHAIINEIVTYCGIDIVQMHGEESPEECEKIIVPVWKAISMKDEKAVKDANQYRSVQGFLLDGIKAGSGESFQWHWAEAFSRKYFTVLAGGLSAENVQVSMNIVHPQVVDVSSAVEKNGKKDEEKIKEFIRSVKNYEYKS